MSAVHSSFVHQSLASQTTCGWTLPVAGACTLAAPQGGTLRVQHGRIWATFDGPHQGPANDWGDRMLQRGDRLQLLPGQQVVLEVFEPAANEPAYLQWEPVTARRRSRWYGALSALGEALSWLLPARGRALSGLEGNQP